MRAIKQNIIFISLLALLFSVESCTDTTLYMKTHKFNNNELSAYNYLSTKLSNNLQNFTLTFQNDVIVSDINQIKDICNQMIQNYNHSDVL